MLMELIKRYKWIIITILPLLILVLIQSTGVYKFRSDAKKWAEPSLNGSNIISKAQIGKIAGDALIVNLDEDKRGSSIQGLQTITIPEDSILGKSYLKTLRANKGPVILYSADATKQARVWMLLSQLGNKNIYILTDTLNQEVLQYNL